uniref:zeta toxin family protein n=1 Tax=Rhizobium sp. PDO1-076 TaxID=1125979 RepID=UPI001FCCB749|nr:zeta toxin family protein [Rhizobium sp. PDO1-076]
MVLIASHAELDRSGPTIRIVGDDLRSYHLNFLAFQRRDPETASQFTQADAGRWTEKLLAAAMERNVNIVFETTMRTPENVARVVGISHGQTSLIFNADLKAADVRSGYFPPGQTCPLSTCSRIASKDTLQAGCHSTAPPGTVMVDRLACNRVRIP